MPFISETPVEVLHGYPSGGFPLYCYPGERLPLSPTLRRKQEEYLAETDDLERSEKFVKIIPIFWVWSNIMEQARDSCTRVRRLWENNSYVMQQDNLILKILFLASLPFGLYSTG